MLNEQYVNDTLRDHTEAIKSHGMEINQLKMNDAVKNIQIDNLVKSVHQLTSAIWWFIAAVGTGVIGMILNNLDK